MSNYYLRINKNGEIIERVDTASPLSEIPAGTIRVEYEKYVLTGLYGGSLDYTISRIKFLKDDIEKTAKELR